MARKKRLAQQSSYLKRETPQMPEGYYSPGPNLNLKRILESFRNQDFTDRSQLATSDLGFVKVDRASNLYNLHKYWSKKGYEAIEFYMTLFSQPGDLVLDPFCGSGGVGVVAEQLDRKAVLIDLSPSATMIAAGYCTPVSSQEIQEAFDRLSLRMSPVLDIAYGTQCSKCGGKGTKGYVVHGANFKCLKCLEITPYPLWKDGPLRKFRGRMSPIKVCPHCEEPLDTQNCERAGFTPIYLSYLCNNCKPKRKYRGFYKGEWLEREQFEKDTSPLTPELEPYYRQAPQIPLREILEPRLYRNLQKAGATTVATLYTPRNAAVLAALIENIRSLKCSDEVRLILEIAFSGIVWITSRQCRASSSQVLDATYYVPHESKELNAWSSFGTKVKLARKVKQLQRFRSTAVVISTQSATDLPTFADNSVDYIFTDPPYGHKYQYGQLNLLWEAWLGLKRDWYDQEMVVAKHRDLGWYDWSSILEKACREMYRVLKPGRWLTLCYHDTAEGTWQLVQDIFARCGFASELSENVQAIDALQKTYNQQTGSTVNKRDLVVNFRKPHPSEILTQLILFGNEDPATFAEKARAILREALETHPGSPADRLYDELVSRMVRKGEFERHNFDELLRSVAEGVGGRWYLLETADQVDEAESAKEAAAAARLEAFMHFYLDERPEELGVHYSDLFEQYLPVQDKPRRLLADWLPEYFFKTTEGTWRPPANEEERAQKEALRTSGTLRRIKRFARALLESVPPHERDHPANVATAADWIRQCRRAGLYEFGRALYEKGGFSFEELGNEGQLEVEEDYQICVRRS